MQDSRTLTAMATARQEVRKSRFLATAGPVPDEAAARAFIAAHSDAAANHNCWAWRVGQACRFQDDGEPGGTAGKPILQAMDGLNLDRVAVVVTRWFGGILLGSGGLMRAYGGTAALCLRGAPMVDLVETASATLACTFSDLALLQARLAALPGATVHSPVFVNDGATIHITVPLPERWNAERLAADLTRGRARLAWHDGLPDRP